MLPEFIYGGMDGIITTVAIISATLGANISNQYALILGSANVLADGFSMGISRYNSLLDITNSSNSNLSKKSPLYSGIATFVFFVIMGFIPLIPFFFHFSNPYFFKLTLLGLSISAFAIIGIIKGIHNNTILKSLFQTLLIGMTGAFISFKVSSYMTQFII